MEPRGFSLTNECEAKRGAHVRTRRSNQKPLYFDSETSITASDRIGAFKGPNVCAESLSRLRFRLTLIRERENSGFHGTLTPDPNRIVPGKNKVSGLTPKYSIGLVKPQRAGHILHSTLKNR